MTNFRKFTLVQKLPDATEDRFENTYARKARETFARLQNASGKGPEQNAYDRIERDQNLKRYKEDFARALGESRHGTLQQVGEKERDEPTVEQLLKQVLKQQRARTDTAGHWQVRLATLPAEEINTGQKRAKQADIFEDHAQTPTKRREKHQKDPPRRRLPKTPESKYSPPSTRSRRAKKEQEGNGFAGWRHFH